MTGMYLEHFHLKRSPFQEDTGAEIFYPGGDRKSVYDKLLQDIKEGKPLVRVSGDEGSGKTLMCKRLIKGLSKDHRVIYVDNPVGSFEKLLRVVCLDLGMAPANDSDEASCTELLGELLGENREGAGKVVLMVDEAEKLFLATLERLVRLICDSEESRNLSVVLVGRPGLNANLDQLSFYCSNVDIHAGYELRPLTESEIANYLDFRLKSAGMPAKKSREIFTKEAIRKIFESAGGSLRMTNILAEESLQTSCSEKSFLVLLDHVKLESDERVVKVTPKRISSTPSFDLPGFIKQNRVWLGSTLAVLIVGGLLLFTGGDESEQDLINQNERPAIQLTESPPTNDPLPQPEAAPESPPPLPVPESRSEPDPRSEAIGAAKDVVEPSVSEPEPTTLHRENGKPPQGKRDGDAIFEKRVRASASWSAGAYRGEYTVQLMMLASDQALENLKKDLIRDPYFGIRNEIYILRKMTSPPTLFVFYGSYKTMDEARQARNNMPVFLRKHHPYPLSISNALKKTED
jgi:type II secretory pathway predicted ATPase ExeA